VLSFSILKRRAREDVSGVNPISFDLYVSFIAGGKGLERKRKWGIRYGVRMYKLF